MFSIQKIVLILLIAAALLACGDNGTPINATASNKQEMSGQPYSQLLVYPNKKKIDNFSLLSHDKKEFNQASLNGRWNLIFMGYTHCPDVCPMTLTDMTHIYKSIPVELHPQFRVIFLSVDPKRDTLEHMDSYISHFHEDFVGVTGKTEQIDQLVGSLGGIYVLNQEDPEFYTVDHTARIFIVDPEGQRFGIIRSEAMQNKDKSELIRELGEIAKS